MKKSVKDTVKEAILPTVTELGYRIWDITYAKIGADYHLEITIDSDDGIQIEDCERVHRAIDPILDEADPIQDAYYLSVSSIGIDRPLKKDKDYARNVGNKLDVKLYAPVNKKKEFLGTLLSYDEKTFTIALIGKGGTADGEMTIARKDAALVRPHIDFE